MQAETEIYVKLKENWVKVKENQRKMRENTIKWEKGKKWRN